MTEAATYDDWTPELQRFSQLVQRSSNHESAGMLALAAELAALRKSQEPQMLTVEQRVGEFDYEAIGRAINAMRTAESVPADLLPQEHETSGFALHRAMPETQRTLHDEQAIIDNHARIKQVGWYCAGGHDVESVRGVVGAKATRNLKFDDPCDHGVPVYVLVKP